MNRAESQRSYVPAAGLDLFLPFYDVVTRLMGADKARNVLLEGVELKAGERVLDVGCGTGTLAIHLKQLQPGLEVAGLDPDPKVLRRARRKAEKAGVAVRFDQGYADALEYPAGAFDHVFSSYMFHHLPSEAKPGMLREVRRVLKPGGQLHLLDFAGPEPGERQTFAHWFHAEDRLRESTQEHILRLISQAGLAQARLVGRRRVMFGLAPVAYYRAEAR